MSSPSAPEQIDPVVAAKAEGEESRKTAVYNQNLGMVNQTGPNGSLSYSMKPGADPNNPQPGDWIATTTLSAPNQQIYGNAQQGIINAQATPQSSQFSAYSDPYAGLKPNEVAKYVQDNGGATQTNFTMPTQTVTGGAQQQLNLANTPQLQGMDLAKTPQLQGVNMSQLQQLQQFDPALLSQLNTDAPTAAKLNTALNLSGVGGITNVTYGNEDKFDTSLLDTPEYQLQAAADRQVVGPAGAIRDTFDTSGVRALPGTIDDTSRQRVEEALFARLNPMLAQEEASTRNNLLNAGMEIGTDGYNRELDRLARSRNDARLATIAQAGQEESRQVGLTQGLNAQEFAQAYAKGQFGQTADRGNNDAAINVANANNSSALNYYNSVNNMGMQGLKFNFDQDVAARSFQNQNIQGNLDNRISVAGANNAAQGQAYNQALSTGNFENNAISGNNTSAFNEWAAENLAMNSNNSNQLGVFNANNAVITGNNANVFNANTATNNALQGNFNNTVTGTGVNNTAAQGNFNNSVTGTGFNNTASTQQLNNNIATGNFANNAFKDSAGLQLSADQLNTQNTANVVDALNSTAMNQGNLGQQKFAQESYLANLPYQQYAAVAGMGNPQFMAPGQGTAQTPQILNGTLAANNAANAQYQAQMGSYNSLLGGAATLGAAAIPLMSDLRLKTNIQYLNQHPSGVGRYSWDWRDGSGSSSGVMAQELQAVRPEAVEMQPSGYLAVRYDLIGGK